MSLRRLAPLGVAPTIVVANDRVAGTNRPARQKTIFVPDAYPDTGTLSGIATGLHQVDGWAIVVACDLPLVSADLFALLAELATGKSDGSDRWTPSFAHRRRL